jgi:hypothetical protein
MVCVMVAWPSISWTIFGLTFFERSRIAHVWRRLWKVKRLPLSSDQSPHPLQQGLEVTMVEVVVVHGLAHAVRENKVMVFPFGSS